MNRFMVSLGLGCVILAIMPVASSPAEEPEMLTRSSADTPTIRWHEDIQSGWRESRRRNVPMVIFITSEKCHYCDAMKKDTWCDSTVRSRIARDFVAIRLNPKRNSSTLSRIKVKMYPTTLIGVPQGKVVGHRLGYQPPEAMHQLLTESGRSGVIR